VFANHDYEPQAIARDRAGGSAARGRPQPADLQGPGDFRKDEVLTLAGGPFSVFTPYKNAWLKRLARAGGAGAVRDAPHAARWRRPRPRLPTLAELGFEPKNRRPLPPGMSGAAPCSTPSCRASPLRPRRAISRRSTARRYLSVHLRFGTLSVRHLVRTLQDADRPAPAAPARRSGCRN
jgi:deoxyribodipyrimidine photo-lyase